MLKCSVGIWRTAMELPIKIDQAGVAAFCLRHHIRHLALFGSILTERFGPESDVDVLVEFDPAHIPGLIALAGMEEELGHLFGRKVDLRTKEDLSPHFRADVLHHALVQYAA